MGICGVMITTSKPNEDYKMIKGYYVDLEGAVVTVVENDAKLYNSWGEVLLEQKETYTSVLTGGWEEGEGFRVDQEYVLWTSLKELSKIIEGRGG